MWKRLCWRRSDLLALVALVLALVLGCSGPETAENAENEPPTAEEPSARDPDVLRIALLPDEESSKVIEDNEGLKVYLEAKTGKPVELHVLPNYTAMIESVRNKHIDLAYFGPLSYCIAVDKDADVSAFAAKTKGGATTYTSVVIANTTAGIDNLTQIKGKRMGYGDPASTSSHLIPKGVLAAGGVAEGEYDESFLGKHDVVARSVESGNIDAGGLSRPIFDGLIENEKIDSSKVKIIAESDPIPQYPWAVQNDLTDELKASIKQAFLSLEDEAVLGPLKAEGFATILDSDYESIRHAAKILGKDLTALQQ
ncbi:MAG: phosphate/phosphite/phosphonate ABC transporter substrate-binding protein [Thermoanaerobaculia bacterium]|nr:phosphate/phosphite/phosphonate ABC transporter substrate-binding protein [Thermoanaerobaculia bacterium]